MKTPRLMLFALVLAACEEPAPPPAGVELPSGACGHGLYVVSTDYQSSSVSIVSYDGDVVGPAMLTSGSEDVALSAPLSGDVVAPAERTLGAELILIDRYPAAVLTFYNPVQATVGEQVSVQTGFPSNPYDALEIGAREVWVARYDENGDPGNEPFDEGSDIVIVDRETGELTARIDLAPALEGADSANKKILPKPARLVRLEAGVGALLAAYSQDFKEQADGRVALLDPETRAIVSAVVLEGGRGCSAMARAPSGRAVAVGCSGTFAGTNTPTLEDSAVYVVDAVDGALTVRARFAAADLGGDPIGFSLAFSTEDRVLVTTFGELGASGEQARPDRLVELDLASGDVRTILESEKAPFTLGDVRCEPACGVCFAADADRSVLHRLEVATGAMRDVVIDDGIGLPPRYLGAY
ncbi:MAG: hypothetical protein U0271_19905 [Polyangiaceae bacterium]